MKPIGLTIFLLVALMIRANAQIDVNNIDMTRFEMKIHSDWVIVEEIDSGIMTVSHYASKQPVGSSDPKDKRATYSYNKRNRSLLGKYYEFYDNGEIRCTAETSGKISEVPDDLPFIPRYEELASGTFHGKCQLYDRENRVSEVLEYQNGRRHGLHTFFNNEGTKIRQDRYHKGWLGQVKLWYPNGVMKYDSVAPSASWYREENSAKYTNNCEIVREWDNLGNLFRFARHEISFQSFVRDTFWPNGNLRSRAYHEYYPETETGAALWITYATTGEPIDTFFDPYTLEIEEVRLDEVEETDETFEWYQVEYATQGRHDLTKRLEKAVRDTRIRRKWIGNYHVHLIKDSTLRVEWSEPDMKKNPKWKNAVDQCLLEYVEERPPYLRGLYPERYNLELVIAVYPHKP